MFLLNLRLQIAMIMALLIFASISQSANISCKSVFFPYRTTNLIRNLRFMSINMEDFFLKVGRYKNYNDSMWSAMFDTGYPKDSGKVDAISRTIIDTDPDFAILQETNSESLEYLVNVKLKGKWKYLLKNGNDKTRHIGFIYKADLDLDFSIETHKGVKWNSQFSKKDELIFARDVPALIVRRRGEQNPILVVLGAHAHAHSKNGSGYVDSKLLQKNHDEKMAMAEIIKSYYKKYENVPVVFGGDFNTNIRNNSEELNPIYQLMAEAFAVRGIGGNDAVTHVFQSAEGDLIRRQIDALFVSPTLVNRIRRAFVMIYRNMIPSDHRPVVMDISTEDIFPEAFVDYPER